MNEKYQDLINLIKKAQGEDRSQNSYALSAGVDSGHLTRILKGNFKHPPKPDFLKKLANKAYNGITYDQLMEAAGYVNKENGTILEPTQELKNLGYEYIKVMEEAKEKGLTPERIRKLIEFVESFDKNKGRE